MYITDTITGMASADREKMELALYTFVIAILVSSSSDTRQLDSVSLYNQDMIGAWCLDFVKVLHKCLEYDPGQHIHQPQQGLIIFHAFRVIFTSLLGKTHPEGHTNKTKVPPQQKALLIRMIRSSGLFSAHCFKDCGVTLGIKRWYVCK